MSISFILSGMEILNSASCLGKNFLNGFLQSASTFEHLLQYYEHEVLRSTYKIFLLLNFVIYNGTLLFTYKILLPGFEYFFEFRNDGNNIFSYLMIIFWFLPVNIIMTIINIEWFDTILQHTAISTVTAIASTKHASSTTLSHASGVSGPTLNNFIQKWVETITNAIALVIINLFFSFTLSCIGKISKILYICLLPFYHSWCTFDYAWSRLGWNMNQRINYIECDWAYMFGFGLIQTLITFAFPNSVFDSIGLNFTMIALLIPVVKIKTADVLQKEFIFRLPLLTPLRMLFNGVMKLFKKGGGYPPPNPPLSAING